jgi:uncharacterized protein YjbI with pentapeptide repeats
VHAADLRGDCARCVGLCCVAPAFNVSADFAIDKPAGWPCPNLRGDHRCGIHDRLREKGFAGCAVYDCFGAGQKVTQITFGGQDWRSTPEIAGRMFAVFVVVRHLHEMLWYLTQALALEAARPLYAELDRARTETERLTDLDPDGLAELDLPAHWQDVNALLLVTSGLARAGTPRRDLRRADLVGKDLRGAALRGADLRGAYLLGADLRHADLRSADLIGADLRGADVRSADLTGALFVTQPQVDVAKGDAATKLPAPVTHPAHWPAVTSAATSAVKPAAKSGVKSSDDSGRRRPRRPHGSPT